MRGAFRFDLAGANAQQMAFVSEHAPELSSHRGIVAPVAKPPAHATPSPFGFQCGEIFSADQSAIVEQCQQDQQI